jgi:hypothetical protein
VYTTAHLREHQRPASTWNANHLAKEVLQGLEGDGRVRDDTIVVTYCNAPPASDGMVTKRPVSRTIR